MKPRTSFEEQDLPAELAAALRAEAITAAERPEGFWRDQRRQVRNRIRQRTAPARPRIGFAVAAATLGLGALLVLVVPSGRVPERRSQPQAQADADQELLLAVEDAVAAGTPEALEPLTLLVEASTNANTLEHTSRKEQRHAD
jgi:hypothetical protein